MEPNKKMMVANGINGNMNFIKTLTIYPALHQAKHVPPEKEY